MNNAEVVDIITQIIAANIDITKADEQAINEIQNAEIANDFRQFKAIHQKHVDELSNMLQAYSKRSVLANINEDNF